LPNFLKPVLALAISVLVYIGYTYLADKGLLDFIRTRYYNPSLIASYINENSKDAEIVQNQIFELQEKFAATLDDAAVRRSFMYNQTNADIFGRSRIFGLLLETTAGLQSVQFIDSNGIRIHYSTSAAHVLSQNNESASYRNYYEDESNLPFDIIRVHEGGGAKFTLYEQYDRIIFSFPFFDSMDILRGTAIFTVSARALSEKLIAEGRLLFSDAVSLIEEPSGILLGSPETSKSDIREKVSEIWSNDQLDRVIIHTGDSGVAYSLVSSKTENGMFIGRLVNNSVFTVSDRMGLVFRLSLMLTFFLTVFFFLNLKPHPLTLVRSRVKLLRDNLFEQLYISKTREERVKWILELEQRRDEIRAELKRNLKLKPKTEKDIDSVIDKAWNELLTVIKTGTGYDASNQLTLEAKGTAVEYEIIGPEAAEEIEELDEIEDAEVIDDVEELDEAPEAEELEEAGETDNVETLDEIEEMVEIEELDEIEEAEAIDDDFDEASNAETLDEIEKIEELEELDELDENEEAEAADEETEEKANASRVGMGLLAIASEIEFNHPVKEEEADDEPLHEDLDIVSPFSSMFSSLDNETTKTEEDKPNT